MGASSSSPAAAAGEQQSLPPPPAAGCAAEEVAHPVEAATATVVAAAPGAREECATGGDAALAATTDPATAATAATAVAAVAAAVAASGPETTGDAAAAVVSVVAASAVAEPSAAVVPQPPSWCAAESGRVVPGRGVFCDGCRPRFVGVAPCFAFGFAFCTRDVVESLDAWARADIKEICVYPRSAKELAELRGYLAAAGAERELPDSASQVVGGTDAEGVGATTTTAADGTIETAASTAPAAKAYWREAEWTPRNCSLVASHYAIVVVTKANEWRFAPLIAAAARCRLI